MYEDITKEKIINTLISTHKWKSTGNDEINFRLHHLSTTYLLMTRLISEILTKAFKKSDCLTEELTHLQSKIKDTTNATD